MNFKSWSIIIFAIFLFLFFMLAFFKSDLTTWTWQLALPILLFIQVFVILKSKDKSDKKWDNDEWYEKN